MALITFNEGSVVSKGRDTYSLSELISINNSTAAAKSLVIRAYDRNNYGGAETYDYGYFTSPDAKISAGNQIDYGYTCLTFDYLNGQYVSRDDGQLLSSYTFTTSDQEYRSTYLSVYSSDQAGATYYNSWLDTRWNHLGDVDFVTRSSYVDSTPNVATPDEIVSIARSFVGKVWDNCGCWLTSHGVV